MWHHESIIWVIKKGRVPLAFGCHWVKGQRFQKFGEFQAISLEQFIGLHMNTIPKGQGRITLKIQEFSTKGCCLFSREHGFHVNSFIENYFPLDRCR